MQIIRINLEDIADTPEIVNDKYEYNLRFKGDCEVFLGLYGMWILLLMKNSIGTDCYS